MNSEYKFKTGENFSDKNACYKLIIIEESLGKEKTNSKSKLDILRSIRRYISK